MDAICASVIIYGTRGQKCLYRQQVSDHDDRQFRHDHLGDHRWDNCLSNPVNDVIRCYWISVGDDICVSPAYVNMKLMMELADAGSFL